MNSLYALPGRDTSSGLFFDNLLSYKEAARYLCVSESFLRKLKAKGVVPYVTLGKRGVRFNLKSLQTWVQEREVR
jgi:excisionase family DNA binding protein